MKKLWLFFDLGGTLLPKDVPLAQSLLAANAFLRALVEKGHRVTINTNRSMGEFAACEPQLGWVPVSLEAGEVLLGKEVGPLTTDVQLGRSRQDKLCRLLAENGRTLTELEALVQTELGSALRIGVEGLDLEVDDPLRRCVVKMFLLRQGSKWALGQLNQTQRQQLLAAMRAVLQPSELAVEESSTAIFLRDLQTGKGQALRYLCGAFGAAYTPVYFGDGPCDEPAFIAAQQAGGTAVLVERSDQMAYHCPLAQVRRVQGHALAALAKIVSELAD